MTKQEFWDRYLRDYDVVSALAEYQSSLDEIAQVLARHSGDLFLDAGSGTGNLSIRLHQLGLRVVSLDFSPTALAIHKEKDPSATVVEASLEAPLPFTDAHFDGVVCANAIFALSEGGMRTAISEFRRVLKPGGVLIVTTTKPGGSPWNAAGSHLRSRFRTRRSFWGFLRETIRLLGPMVRVLLGTIQMRRLAAQDGYRQLTREQLLEAVSTTGFTEISCGSTYGGRCHLLEACSPQAARIDARPDGPEASMAEVTERSSLKEPQPCSAA